MTSSLTMMPFSTSHPSPLTFRRCTTVTRPDHPQGLVIEYTLINPPGSVVTPPPSTDRQQSPTQTNYYDTKLPPLKVVDQQQNNSNISPPNSSRRHRPWLGLPNATNPSSTTTTTGTDKRKRLERMNLRGESRTVGTNNNRASYSLRTNSSCKRSDSATNDSQKSIQTGNSLDDHLSEDRLRQISQKVEIFEKDEELTEEKIEKRRNFQKCMNWIDDLPTKFTGMHIAQERAPVTND